MPSLYAYATGPYVTTPPSSYSHGPIYGAMVTADSLGLHSRHPYNAGGMNTPDRYYSLDQDEDAGAVFVGGGFGGPKARSTSASNIKQRVVRQPAFLKLVVLSWLSVVSLVFTALFHLPCLWKP